MSAMERRTERGGRPGALYVSLPVTLLLALFLAPLGILLVASFTRSDLSGKSGGFTLDNFRTILTEPLYLKVLLNTALIASASMLVMLAIAIPLAYLLAFRAGRLELPLLLALVLADELNPIVKIYAWRMLLGRHGIINSFLMSIGVIDRPIEWLLFSSTAVVIVLAMSWITYTTIPIYAAMKAIDPGLLEAGSDLGGGLLTRFRKIVIPLAAPGIFVSLIIVYIPLFSEFATPTLIGGTSGYMIGNVIQENILELGNWGAGSAMSFLLLALSGVLALVSYRLSHVSKLATSS